MAKAAVKSAPIARDNAVAAKRFASDGVRHWVYGRAGEHCLKCDATIAMKRQGAQLRSTYFCPRCQPPAACQPAHTDTP